MEDPAAVVVLSLLTLTDFYFDEVISISQGTVS